MKRFAPSLLLLATLVSAAAAIDTTSVALGAGGTARAAWGSADSIRRASGPIDSARALERLAADIEKIVALPDERKAGRVGIAIRSITRGKDLFRLNADAPLTPASTTKVVTAYTALCELGGDYMIRTVIGAANRPNREGTLVGDLYVKGYGDPFFSASDVDVLVDRFMTSNIRRVEGRVVGDGTYFDGKTRRIEYSGDDDVVVPLPPITALTINGNTFTVLVSAPQTPGLPLNVQTIPRTSGIDVVSDAVAVGSAKSTKSRSRKRSSLPADAAPVDVTREEPRYGDEPMPEPFLLADASQRRRTTKKQPAATTRRSTKPDRAPAKRESAPAAKRTESSTVKTPAKGLKVAVTMGPDGRQIVSVTGSLSAGKRASYTYEMKAPAVVIAGMVADRIRGRGVAITGATVADAAPTRIKTLAVTERPLLEILQLVMKNSNNYLAEYVFKMIGAHAGARNETARATVQTIGQRMSSSRVGFDRCIINDGSGLSRRNLLSAASLADILAAAHRDRKVFQPFYASMSVAGVDGTLRRRMKGTLAEGNVHGKTGTLRNVSALTGYVTTRDGELVAFAMLMNGGNHGSYKSVQDKVALRLAEFSYRAQ